MRDPQRKRFTQRERERERERERDLQRKRLSERERERDVCFVAGSGQNPGFYHGPSTKPQPSESCGQNPGLVTLHQTVPVFYRRRRLNAVTVN